MKTQTIEATGKGWKLTMLVGALGIVLGVAALFQDLPTAGLVLLVAGISALVLGRAGAWWFHGAILLAVIPAHAADLTVIENRHEGQKTSIAENVTEEGDVYVTTSHGTLKAGRVGKGETADVTVIEQRGAKPIVIFEKR